MPVSEIQEGGPQIPSLVLPPPPDSERLKTLDLVRGVAILGILPVNIGWFFTARQGWWNPWEAGGQPGDRFVAGLTWFIFEQKFITLFSILFGAGLAVRFDRARARSQPFAGRLLRRQLVLLVLGLLHVSLLFFGDVLTTYALIGSFAWLACALGPKGVLGLAVACFAGACAVWGWMLALPNTFEILVYPLAQNLFILLRNLLAPGAEAVDPESWFVGNFASASPGVVVAQRLSKVAYFVLVIWITYGLYVLACFMVGIYLVRRRVFHEPAARRDCLTNMVVVGVALGLPLNAAYVILQARHPGAPFLWLCIGIAAPPLALAYLGLLVRWADSAWLPWLQRCLRATGRMALTNYLMQSFFMCWLFTMDGLGPLANTMTRSGAMGAVVCIWVFQIALSTAWMQLFRIGPAEWLWRRLSGERGRGFVRSPGEPAEIS